MGKLLTSIMVLLLAAGCKSSASDWAQVEVKVVGAMRNTMWHGALGPQAKMDSLVAGRSGVYGLGPLSYLRGELLLFDGIPYVSRADSTLGMTVDTEPSATAPFFVYAFAEEWEQRGLPDSISNIESLERYLNKWAGESSKPFPFLLKGKVSQAQIHIQNLPPGTTVRSPQEAHQGQLDFDLIDSDVDILGFFSTRHQGVFTHHDSYVHMHLITADRSQMGHLDSWKPADMVLFLPVR